MYVPGLIIGNERNAKAVATVDCLVFDLDVATPDDLDIVAGRLRRPGSHALFTQRTPTGPGRRKFALMSTKLTVPKTI